MPLRTCRSTVVVAALIGGLVVVVPGSAGPEKVAFPVSFTAGVLYTTVDRHDVKQYRELYTSAEAIQAAKAGKPLPSGTVITLVQYKAQVDAQGNPLKAANGRFVKGDLIAYTVMEKRDGWGLEYPENLRNGDWEYAAFGGDHRFNAQANYLACFQCHKPHEKQHFVISYPAMAGRTVVAAVQPPAAEAAVKIAGFAFGPAKLTVPAGKPVTWTNADDSPHMIVVQGTPLRTDLLVTGQSASLTFDQTGAFNYICGLHPNMKGTVEVRK